VLSFSFQNEMNGDLIKQLRCWFANGWIVALKKTKLSIA